MHFTVTEWFSTIHLEKVKYRYVLRYDRIVTIIWFRTCYHLCARIYGRITTATWKLNAAVIKRTLGKRQHQGFLLRKAALNDLSLLSIRRRASWDGVRPFPVLQTLQHGGPFQHQTLIAGERHVLPNLVVEFHGGHATADRRSRVGTRLHTLKNQICFH